MTRHGDDLAIIGEGAASELCAHCFRATVKLVTRRYCGVAGWRSLAPRFKIRERGDVGLTDRNGPAQTELCNSVAILCRRKLNTVENSRCLGSATNIALP